MPDEQKATRKLRAIFSADVKGYSLLMADDEAFTIQTLKDYRTIMSKYIEQNNGRVVDAPGDNMLAEFSSAVDAVQCGVEIQKVLKEKNEELPDNKQLEFRIGINIGDVVQEEDRIYGSGVNVAARIEGLAEPGGVCISRNAYDHIKDKLNLGYEYLGQHEVKNIKDPVRVYKVLLDPEDAGKLIGEEPKRAKKKWVLPVVIVAAIIVTSIVWHFYQNIVKPDVEPASIGNMAFPLPDKPSIAVLPFTNMSDDPKQEYFSDGITEEIITALSKIEKLFVIARNSTFTYKGKSVKIQKVSEELGVQYVLEGSVRKFEDKVRITAQLIDATTGHHIWAERYDRDLNDIFELQDEITMRIVSAMEVKLTEGEQAQISVHEKVKLDSYLMVLQARDLARHQNIEDNHKARKILEEAIALDPNHAIAYRWLSATHFMDVWLGSTPSPRESFKRAAELANKALSIDASLGQAHAILGNIYVMTRQYEKGLPELRKAVRLEPNSADVYAYLAMGLLFADESEEAILLSKKAIRLNPFAPSWYLHNLAATYRNIKKDKEGLVYAEKAAQQEPKNILSHLVLCSIYSLLGRMEEARVEADNVMNINPNFSLIRFEKRLPLKNLEAKNRYIEALRNAGLQ